MRRILAVLLLLLMILPGAAAEGASVEEAYAALGQKTEIRYYLPENGQASIILTDMAGTPVKEILPARNLLGGTHILSLEEGYFDALPAGDYRLVLAWEGSKAAGILHMGNTYQAADGLYAQETPAADSPVMQDAPAVPAVPADSGDAAENSAPTAITPALRSTYTADHKACYWCTPMDIADEEAVWAMLTAPVTVVDINQREQALLYAEPDTASEAIAVITGASQAVHVLEERNGWTLVEAYSSSFHDSKVKNWNAFVAGYIQSSKLKKVTVNQDYGIVIDKLTQRLYLFHEGHMMAELLVSTGLYNDRQPYNETRSGEFLIISRVGDFKSDELVCAMGLRFNSGDLLHEVPHTLNADGSKNYKKCESKLGTRASHGCIRVQRKRNADGINMRWLWDNIKVGTKLVVWEDYQGRQIVPPADDTPVYYNPDGGSSYHAAANCKGVKDQYLPLTALTYGELETEAFSRLTACDYCCPPMRKGEIEAINEEHLDSSPGEIMAFWVDEKKK